MKKTVTKKAANVANKGATNNLATKKSVAKKRMAKKIVTKKRTTKHAATPMAKSTADDASESLLFELGTEELPPHALPRLGASLARALCEDLYEARLVDAPEARHEWFAAPRRLAVWVPGVRVQQIAQLQERRGPRVTAAFDENGAASPAALGFAKSCGVAVQDLHVVESADGKYLVHRTSSCAAATELIPRCVAHAVRALPIPKRMRWGTGTEEFVRPVHWLVLMHGARVIAGQMFGLRFGNKTRGHRVHCNRNLIIKHADDYAGVLEKHGRVLPGFATRRARIVSQLQTVARDLKADIVADDALLEEVTGLVEWPVTLTGAFDESFMQLPAEVLVSAMQKHQRYFPARDKKNNLLPRFAVVVNIESTEPQRVVRGNERVLHARLSDARFFWHNDIKTKLKTHAKQLAHVLFHEKLGSVAAKVGRLNALSEYLASALGDDFVTDINTVRDAALLAKADLVTDVVREFAELQGLMGGHYALHDGHAPEVACAITEHYLPRFAGDVLPQSRGGQLLALADRLDTLVGIFASGEKLRGDKDPYGLRRAALGVLRILIEAELHLPLAPCLQRAVQLYAHDNNVTAVVRATCGYEPGHEPGRKPSIETGNNAEREHGQKHNKARAPAHPNALAQSVLRFILERLRAWSAERDFRPEDFAAVMALRPDDPLDFYHRMQAVAAFRKMQEAPALAAANKRIANILERVDAEDAPAIGKLPDENLYREPAERTLADSMQALSQQVRADVHAHRYTQALQKLAVLQQPVDDFFNQVMVMCDDKALRHNRLALLAQLRTLCNGIADIATLVLK